MVTKKVKVAYCGIPIRVGADPVFLADSGGVAATAILFVRPAVTFPAADAVFWPVAN